MFGNVWLLSALSVITLFSTSMAYKSYSDIQEIKQIQENYEIIKDIKTLLSKQHNILPSEITRDDIIAHLPKGENWGKILLLDRDGSDDLQNNALINSNGDIELSQDEKLKLLALKAKLKMHGSENEAQNVDGRYIFKIADEKRNRTVSDKVLKRSIQRTIEILYIYKDSITVNKFSSIIKDNMPYVEIYQVKSKDEAPAQLKLRKEIFFKKQIEEKLLHSRNSKDLELYNNIKGFL